MLITEFGRRWDGGALPRRRRCERPKHWLAALHEEPVLPGDVVAEFVQATAFGGPDDRDHEDLAASAGFAHIGV